MVPFTASASSAAPTIHGRRAALIDDVGVPRAAVLLSCVYVEVCMQ